MNIINVGYDSTNYYVVENKGPRLLVDAGWPGTLPKFISSLKRKGLALSDLGYVLVTHYHPDHAGLVQELKNAGVKHVVLEEQRAGMALLKSQVKAGSGYVDIRLDDNLYLSSTQSRAWLKSIGLQGEVVSTPGHSDDSICLVLDEGLAFTGDLTFPFEDDTEQARTIQNSWEKLRRLMVRNIHPGHGPSRPMP